MTTYLWSNVYMQDKNLVVSHRDKPVIFQGPASLYGLTIGAVLGRQLDDFEADIRAGKIYREDTRQVTQNLEKLRLKRIDATFIPLVSLPYYRQQIPNLDQWLYIADKPRGIRSRQLMVALSQRELMNFLNQAITTMPQAPELALMLDEDKILSHGKNPTRVNPKPNSRKDATAQ
ncbi:MAG: substrate-binding periplasmic protein [Deefgea sp.]